MARCLSPSPKADDYQLNAIMFKNCLSLGFYGFFVFSWKINTPVDEDDDYDKSQGLFILLKLPSPSPGKQLGIGLAKS